MSPPTPLLPTGSYPYICFIHPYMAGSVTVQVGGLPLPLTPPDIFQSQDTAFVPIPPPPVTTSGVGEVCVSQQFETPLPSGTSGVVHCLDAKSFSDLPLTAFDGMSTAGIDPSCFPHIGASACIRKLAFPTDTAQPGLAGRRIGGRFEGINNAHGLWLDKAGRKMFAAEWHGGQFHTVDRMTNTIVQTTPIFPGADVGHIITTLPSENVGVLSLQGGVTGNLGLFDTATSAMTQIHSFGPIHHPHGLWVTCTGGGNGGGVLISASPMSNSVAFTNLPATPTGSVNHRIVTPTLGLYPFHVGARSDCTKAYVPNALSNTVEVYDVLSGQSQPPVMLPPCPTCTFMGVPQPLMPGPIDIAVTPNNQCAMVTLSKAGQVALIDTIPDTVVLPLLDCGNGCHGSAFGPKKGSTTAFYWYGSSTYENKVTVVQVDTGGGCSASHVGDIPLNVRSLVQLQGLTPLGCPTCPVPLLPLPHRGGGMDILTFPQAPPWHLGVSVIN